MLAIDINLFFEIPNSKALIFGVAFIARCSTFITEKSAHICGRFLFFERNVAAQIFGLMLISLRNILC